MNSASRLRRLNQTTDSGLRRKKRQSELNSLSPQELWERYRPLQGYLDIISPTARAQLLASSRESVFQLLKERSELDGLELRGDTLHPLGLKLD